MNIAVYLKDNLSNIPPYIGRIVNYLPYSFRPGIARVYNKRRQQIHNLDSFDTKGIQQFVFDRLKPLVYYSYSNIKAYKIIYDSYGFHPDKLKDFHDIQKIPIVTKSLLNQFPLEERSVIRKGRYIVNTGGSSGTPFGFYIEPNSMGHEWAHMHNIWERLDYKVSDFKLVFGGRSNVKNFIQYDVIRNSFSLDIYAPYERINEKLRKILTKYKIKYLHGYPSSIYDYAIYCEAYDPEIIKLFQRHLKGAFLGSEYPHKHYREAIERIFGLQTISWYGHTERTILAGENGTPFRYEPFLTYGFTEAIPNQNKEIELIGTSYYNYASPLIRYNTEDIINNPEYNNGILKSFQILKGRSGEAVIDRMGKSINLTALIFGRHHELFNYSRFIQVRQPSPGKIEIYYVSEIDEGIAASLFDCQNLNFDITFKKVLEPIRSISGKVGLLIK